MVETAEKRRLSRMADSPWIWLLAFSLMAIVAIAVIQKKYSQRQAGIELRAQARDAAVQRTGGGARATVPERPTAASLGAIVAILVFLAVLSAAELFFQYRSKRG